MCLTPLIKETKTNRVMNFMQLYEKYQGHEDLSSSSCVPISEHRKPWSDVAALCQRKPEQHKAGRGASPDLNPWPCTDLEGKDRRSWGYIPVILVQQELPLSPGFPLLWFDSSLFLQRFGSSLSGFRQEEKQLSCQQCLQNGMSQVN